MVRDRRKYAFNPPKVRFVLFFIDFTLPPNHILPEIAIWLPARFVF
jgi:hypothetical protein